MRGLSYPFRIESGAIASTTNLHDIVRAQVVDTLTTNYGERVFHPDYGANCQGQVFNPSEEIERSDFGAQIQQKLIAWCPRAQILGVDVSADILSPNIVYVSVSYQSSVYGQQETIQANFNVAPSLEV